MVSIAPGVMPQGRIERQRTESGRPPSARSSGADTVSPKLLTAFAHELRAPLATLRATTDLLADATSFGRGEVGHLVHCLQRSVAWLEDLIENLTIWTALEAGQISLQRRPMRVRECAEAACALVQPLLDRKQQRVRLIGPTSGPCILADFRLLRQVLVNLLVNAHRYSWPDDCFTLTIAHLGDLVELRITDHGQGIPQEEHEYIFERHTRGEMAPQAYAQGLGLGLYIVQSLVHAHGGTVGVESAPGEGASFWIRLRAETDVPEPTVVG